MNEADILTALGDRLDAAALGVPILWPNTVSKPPRPMLDVEFVPVDRSAPTLDGAVEWSTGLLQVQVVVAEETGRNAAMALVDQVRQTFPFGTSIAITDGAVKITKPPSARQGFEAGPDWIVPVVITYEARST